MKVNILNRLAVAAGIGAVALLGLSVSSYATPRQGQSRKEDQKQQKQQNKADQARARQHQQELVNQQQQRLTQYRDHLNQQQRVGKPQVAQLQQEKRQAQYAVQQQYVARLHQQQLTVQRQRPGTFGRDPYFSTPANYRYAHDGRSYETNQYGVNLLKQAVNYGYDQGYRTGEADRMDHARSDFRGSFAYQDANYGYTGFYVDRDDYNFYFREGFRRGYDDGFSRHTEFGVYSNGRGTVLDAVLGSIFNVQVIVR
jgi:flagellar biosynthesis GTPase FlhF